jgi:hypothetical protein
MSHPPLPPLEERDGSQAAAAAADKEDWTEVTSADGHLYRIPPEVAYLVAGGMSWQGLEAVLRPALAARAAATAAVERKSGGKGAALATQAFVRAVAAYQDEGADLVETWTAETFAREVEAFAMRQRITGAHLIKPRNHTTRQLAACVLDGVREIRQRHRK